MPIVQGLFGGGTPYPVSPAVQPGLMQDAWRQFGVQLLANAQNPDIGQGLAAALAAGQQAYSGGAEQAYQVGRQQQQDKQYQEFRRAQIQAAEALAEQRRQDAETKRRRAEEAAEAQAQTGEQIREMLEKMTPEERAAFQRARLLGEQGLPAALVTELSGLPEEPAPANWRAVPGVPGMVFNPSDPTQTMRVATPPAKPGREPEADPMLEIAAGIESLSLPPEDKAVLRSAAQVTQGNASQMGQLLRELREEQAKEERARKLMQKQELDKQGLFARIGEIVSSVIGGGEEGAEQVPEVGAPQTAEDVVSLLPEGIRSIPGLQEQVQRDLDSGKSPEQIISEIQAAAGGRGR